MFSPPGVVTNGYPTPTHVQENVTPPSHIRLSGHPGTPTNHVPLLGDVRRPSSHVCPAGDLNSSLPDVGLTRFKPSPEVAMLGPLNNTALKPVDSTQSASLESQKLAKASLRPSPSKQIVPVVSNKLRSRKGNR